MAWLMENNASPPHVRAAENWHLVPVVNIARQSMHNHKDAAWLFDACGVDAHALLFADEVKKFSNPIFFIRQTISTKTFKLFRSG